jgi:hypothetical protein
VKENVVMKTMKHMLLAGSALVAATGVARADDLSALKAEIETLQSRVSELEAQPQASMPSGYSLMSIRDGQSTFQGVLPERSADKVRENQGFTLSVLPTADAAPAAEVSVSGEIRTALLYTDFEDDDNADVAVRARLVVKGKADTAVGEVGGYFRFQTSGGGDFSDYSEEARINKAYGWWKFAPNWELMAGYNDNTAVLQTSWDWLAATAPTRTFGPSNPYNEQMRLTYSDGPLSFAIALEDPDRDELGGSDLPALQGYAMYSTGSLTGQVVGLWQSDDIGDNDDWAVGGGVAVGISDGFQFLVGAVVGEGTTSYAANLSPLTTDEGFWAGSAGILANLSDDTRLEFGVGYEDYDEAGKALGIGGGVYWDPVSQVTLGAGATYIDFDDAFIDDDGIRAVDDDSLEVFVGTWLRFP